MGRHNKMHNRIIGILSCSTLCRSLTIQCWLPLVSRSPGAIERVGIWVDEHASIEYGDGISLSASMLLLCLNITACARLHEHFS
jgi:hypothetical protein